MKCLTAEIHSNCVCRANQLQAAYICMPHAKIILVITNGHGQYLETFCIKAAAAHLPSAARLLDILAVEYGVDLDLHCIYLLSLSLSLYMPNSFAFRLLYMPRLEIANRVKLSRRNARPYIN